MKMKSRGNKGIKQDGCSNLLTKLSSTPRISSRHAIAALLHWPKNGGLRNFINDDDDAAKREQRMVVQTR